jgi:hypothetical protein
MRQSEMSKGRPGETYEIVVHSARQAYCQGKPPSVDCMKRHESLKPTS